jgi:hypothetical protein
MTQPSLTSPAPRRGFRLRPLIRAIHRDVGYFAVGLTFIYALSGLAVNHIADWDPNFHQIDKEHVLDIALPEAPEEAGAAVARALGYTEPPDEVYLAEPGRLEVLFEHTTLHVNLETRQVLEEGQRPRLLLRVANWLHLNRGKKSWTYVADAYAVFLLYLATSGLFMIKGKKGLIGRGGVLGLLGVLVPIVYVVLSGGP